MKLSFMKLLLIDNEKYNLWDISQSEKFLKYYKDIHILSCTIEELVSLMHPLEYQYLIFSVLPEENYSFTSTYRHFIFGINDISKFSHVDRCLIIQKYFSSDNYYIIPASISSFTWVIRRYCFSPLFYYLIFNILGLFFHIQNKNKNKI